MKNCKIILADKNDSEEILKLYKAQIGGAADWNEHYPSEETIEFDLKRNALFVMKNESNEIIAVISIDDDQEVADLNCWNKELEPSAELARLCVREDMRNKGISPVYLVTDHTGFYERYGWEFLCMVQGDGEEDMTRMYIHK